MKQTLQLKLTQHLTLTPQLQQSIRLLQLSTLELNAEVDRMLQENPLLEREEGEDEAPPQEFPLAARRRVRSPPSASTRDDDGDGDADGMTGVDIGADPRRPARRHRLLRLRRRRAPTATGAAADRTRTTTSRRSKSPPARCAIT